ncbi:proliferating cell nuclear antigen (pcna) [Candidatus Woesearchaeota archaeon]|nr:proliferating cell nuclear antigen (pcna) [Candidatus Woesearchaeota archaeon]
MRLTLAEPRFLKESVSIISDLVTEGRFRIGKNSMQLVAMDPANVAMVMFNLLSSCFTEYNIDKEMEIAINLSNLKQILRRVKPEDMLSLEIGDNKLDIVMKGGTLRSFSLPIIDLEEKEQKIPELKFPVSITTSSAILSEAIEDADIVAESVSFVVEPKRFTIMGEGDLSQAKIEVKADDETKIEFDADDKVRAKYSIEYLKKMISAAKLTDNVIIRMNKDYPLKLEYNLVDKLQLAFILAPRVEND